MPYRFVRAWGCRGAALVVGMLLSLGGASVSVMAVQASPMPPEPVASVESMLAAPAQEIFALRTALPQIEPPLALLARARVAAARLDGRRSAQLVEQFLATGEASDPRQRAIAWEIAADAAFADGDYARAAKAAQQLQAALVASRADAAEQAGAAQTAAMAVQLAALPMQQKVAYQPKAEPVRRDKVGLPRATASIDGRVQEVVLDTGANLSVLSLSTARRLGLHLQQGGASVGSSSRDAVAVRLGLADTLSFAGLTLHDVPFLVLDDAQLAMPVPGGYRIDAILGFPVLRALQRFRITAAGRLEPSLSTANPAAAETGNLLMVGNDMYVQANVGGASSIAMHLDSGAASSALSAGFARRHAALLKGLPSRRAHVAGAGGAVERRTTIWPAVQVSVGDRATTLARMDVELAGDADTAPNVLGEDVLGAFEWWSVDFGRMRLELGPPNPEVPQARHVP
ncbi:retropepsin-like aspartic protease family protein [Rhodanobacter hydrolyticus]|uniref:Retropepsin-like domain-containing protein n=1 Tax=Rhodanobacter hydrolyticus TaxID=2250595 RepID=A0ABW8J9S7_9GAMM